MINSAANLALRDQALSIYAQGPVENLNLDDLVMMLDLFHRSCGEEHIKKSDQIPDEIRIIRDIQKLFPRTAFLAELRELFRNRAFADDVVAGWVNLSANIIALTGGMIIEGYTEYGISMTPSPYRWPPDMIEYLRRKFVDLDANAEEFVGIYDHSGA
jgi:hypothetical protein